MKIWLALLAAPSLALACQSIMYALVTPSCSVQTRLLVHAVALGGLVLAALFTLLARGEWAARAVATPEGPDSDKPDAGSVRRFLAMVATAVGGLSCLVIITMWIGAWVLSPCWQ
jgi:hypothetical protein